MAEYFAGGHLRFLYGEWRDDDGDVIEISKVRHGRWIPKSKDGSWRVDTCSSCRKDTYYVRYAPAFDYCPNCGAKMDLEG